MARSVSTSSGLKPNGEMNAIGLLVAALSALLLVPILPFLAVSKVVDWLRGSGA